MSLISSLFLSALVNALRSHPSPTPYPPPHPTRLRLGGGLRPEEEEGRVEMVRDEIIPMKINEMF